jgi:hypothetical protein
MDIEKIARVCHEANRAWCAANGDHSQVAWENAEGWQRESTFDSVKFALANPQAPDSAQHDSWMELKLSEGWRYGAAKDAVATRASFRSNSFPSSNKPRTSFSWRS